jgi:hypothetical protein
LKKRTPDPQQPQKDFLGDLSLRRKMRQARIRESSELILHFRLTMLWLRDPSPDPGTAQAPPYSLIIGWESPGSALLIGQHKF